MEYSKEKKKGNDINGRMNRKKDILEDIKRNFT
jgi:hypothetical protein